MATPPRTQSERAERTRGALIDAARGLFAERGYAETSIEDVLRAAGVSRGALYHHFEDKRALFQVVYEQVDREILEAIIADTAAIEEPWEQARAGLATFLDVCMRPDVQRIALQDAPSVLGWETWRAIDAQHGLGAMQATLAILVEQGLIADQPVAPLAHLLLGALSEAGLMIAQADDPRAARAEIGESVDRLFQSLRLTSGTPKT